MLRNLLGGLAVLIAGAAAGPAGAQDTPVYELRFTDHEAGAVDAWLEGKGFEFREDAKNRERIDLEAGEAGLDLIALRKAFGFMTNESVDVPEFSFIEIDWGVERFPEGTSYEQGVRNEAIMVHVFMGDERVSSGSMFVPDSPYFIGLFLCHGDDRTGHPYVGAYFTKGGRYVCLERPEAGAMVTTRFDLMGAYRRYFDKEGDDDPGISGLGIAVDTSKAKGDGTSAAFIRAIRFYR